MLASDLARAGSRRGTVSAVRARELGRPAPRRARGARRARSRHGSSRAPRPARPRLPTALDSPAPARPARPSATSGLGADRRRGEAVALRPGRTGTSGRGFVIRPDAVVCRVGDHRRGSRGGRGGSEGRTGSPDRGRPLARRARGASVCGAGGVCGACTGWMGEPSSGSLRRSTTSCAGSFGSVGAAGGGGAGETAGKGMAPASGPGGSKVFSVGAELGLRRRGSSCSSSSITSIGSARSSR